jgi:GDP-D-mannose dehydratase
MESKFSADARKEFPQHPDGVWDPLSLLFKGYRDSFFCATGFTHEVKDFARSGLEHTHPSCQWITGGSFRKIQRRRHETNHTAIQRDLKKPVRISSVIKHFIVTC